MRSTNLTGEDARNALEYLERKGISMTAKLERELERNARKDGVKYDSKHRRSNRVVSDGVV